MVTRYDPIEQADDLMEEAENGEFVEYRDYAELEGELSAFREEAARLLDELKAARDKGFTQGMAYMIAQVAEEGFHVNQDDLFWQPGITFDDLKEAGVDDYDLKRIARAYKAGLRKHRRSFMDSSQDEANAAAARQAASAEEGARG